MLKSLGLWKNKYEDVMTLFVDNKTNSNEEDKSLRFSQNAVDTQSNRDNEIPHLSNKKLEIEDEELDDRSFRFVKKHSAYYFGLELEVVIPGV